MHVDSVYLLGQALGLDPPGTPVRVAEPFQMLGEIAPDLREALGVDVVGVGPPANFSASRRATGSLGRPSAARRSSCPVSSPPNPTRATSSCTRRATPPCRPAHACPSAASTSTRSSRQEPIDDEHLDPADNAEEFTLLTPDDLAHIKRDAERAADAGLAVVFGLGDTGFGDIAFVPGLKLKHPRGIRDVQQWYMSLSLRPDHLYEVFERQCEAGLDNLRAVHKACGEAVTSST